MSDEFNKAAHLAKDVAAGAATGYWLSKAASGDPRHVDEEDSQGRIVPTVRVRSNAEYGVVVAGQITAGHFLWPIFAAIWLAIPIGGVILAILVDRAFLGTALAPPWLVVPHALGILLVVTACLGCVVLFVWWTIKCWKWIFRRGPKISYADGYRGPLGNLVGGETKWTVDPHTGAPIYTPPLITQEELGRGEE